MIKISPSVASSDLLHVSDTIRYVDENYSDIHLDIEDGVYLPNISFGFRLAKAVCAATRSERSLHLMVHDPLFWIEDVRACSPERCFVHLDHRSDAEAVLQAYRRAGIPVGLGLSNRDLGRDLSELLPLVDTALVLTAVIEDPLQRYSSELEDFAASLVPHLREVWVDGGVKFTDLERLEQRGLHAAVMGRAVFQR